MSIQHINPSNGVARNACKLCAPLGACLAYRGIQNCMPLLHGSQGCATYIRRYLISHYKEPVDIASSSFGERAAIFGGEANLAVAIDNLIQQYHPDSIGIATTCLSETIGDDVRSYIRTYVEKHHEKRLPYFFHASTPSYSGTHADGYRIALRSIVETLAEHGESQDHINVIPNMLSPADLRQIKEILDHFGFSYVLLPDYSETLDGPAWEDFQRIPEGGTPLREIQKMGDAKATLELGQPKDECSSAGACLLERFAIPLYRIEMPVGIRLTDTFFRTLESISSRKIPSTYQAERGRLIDAYTDAHKYVFEKRAVVYGESDFVVSMAQFLLEIGMIPVVCATGESKGKLRERLSPILSESAMSITVMEGVDFLDIETQARALHPDLILGSSKGYSMARRIGIPLVRCGFPIHDRIGGGRIKHIGYQGTQELFDRITNALLEARQDGSDVGYSYM